MLFNKLSAAFLGDILDFRSAINSALHTLAFS